MGRKLWIFACLVGTLTLEIDGRPLTARGRRLVSVARTVIIKPQTAELMLPVVGINETSDKGPCEPGTASLVSLQVTVLMQVDPATAAATTDSLDPPEIIMSTRPATNQQPSVTPCLMVDDQQQQQQQQRRPNKERMRLPTGSGNFTYTAYFRPMSRDLCGTQPKVVIETTVQSTNQQPEAFTTEIDIVPWGCAFLIGDADSPPPPVPAGMPGPVMKQPPPGAQIVDDNLM